MHIFSVAQCRCRHCIIVHNLSVHVHSDVLKRTSVELVLSEEPSAHVTVLLWRSIFTYYPPPSPDSYYFGTRAGENKIVVLNLSGRYVLSGCKDSKLFIYIDVYLCYFLILLV
jgi:hypothetical protein